MDTKIRCTMKEYTDDLLPQVSDTLHADDMMVKVEANGGRYHYVWNLLDQETRFLIASRMSTHRTGEEAKRLFTQSKNLAARPPKLLITDKLRSYREAYGEVLEPSGTEHLASPRFVDRTNNNRVERWFSPRTLESHGGARKQPLGARSH